MTGQNALKINVRISGALKEHVSHAVSDGDFENVSEYVRDLIRKDKAQKEADAFNRLKAQLQSDFAVPESAYETVTADDIRARVRARQTM